MAGAGAALAAFSAGAFGALVLAFLMALGINKIVN
jgi:hypothetical protein